MSLVWKILREHIRIAQWIGYMVANIFGLGIVLLGMQLYLDVAPLLNTRSGFMKPDYLVVTKPVSTMGTLTGAKPSFDSSEIEDLRQQSFVRQLGEFTAARYHITGQIAIDKLDVRLATDLFFESVPESFVDVSSSEWRFDEGDQVVPIIIPQDYLSLYNFGFAQSSGLPAVSENLIRRVRFDLYLNGNGQSGKMVGKVVGFSTRLNTILVPSSFIEWSNARFAKADTDSEPSRLILQVTNPSDRHIAEYIEAKGYHIDRDKLDASKAGWLLRMMVIVVMIIGGVICVLACYVLLLSIFLLLQKNRQAVRDLLLIGYPAAKVSYPYQLMVCAVNAISFAFSLLIVWLVQQAYAAHLAALVDDWHPASMGIVTLLALVMVGLITSSNILLIYRHVKAVEN